MAQSTEIAQLYYTLGARADASTQSVLQSQETALDGLAEAAQAAGVPMGALQAAVTQLVDEVEGELRAAVVQLGKEMEDAGASAASLAEATAAITEASAQSTASLSQQVKLYAQGTQIAGTRQQSLAQLSAIEQQLKGRLDGGNLSLEQRIRLEAVLAQTQVATVAALGRTSGAITTTQRSTAAAGAAIKDLGSRWSGTALNVVTAASSIAQAGSVSSGGLKAVLTGAASLAGFMGAGGALVTAAAIAANAIISVFTKAREEAKKAADETLNEIRRLQNAGDFASINERLRVLDVGTAGAGYQDGIRAITAQLTALDAQIAKSGVFGALDKKTRDEREALARVLDEKREQYEIAKQALLNIAEPGRAAPLPIRTTVQSDERSAEDAKRRAESAKAEAAAFRDVKQAVDDLVGSVRVGESVLGAFDRKVREIEDAFAKLKAPTAAQTAEFQKLRGAAAAARATLVTLTADQAAQEFIRLRNALLPEALRDYSLALVDLRRELERKGLTDERIGEIVALTEAVQASQRALSQLESFTSEVLESSLVPMEKLNLLTRERQTLEAEFIALSGKRGPEYDEKRLSIQQRLLAIEEAMAKVGAQNTQLVDAAVDSGFQLATVFEDATSAALGISTALFGAEASITRIIGGAAQVASSFSRVADLASKAQGFGALFSTGAGIASALPAIGGIIGGVAAIASQFGETPAQKEARELLRRNNERLEQLRITLGDALKQSSSGRTIAGVGIALRESGVVGADVSSGPRELIATVKTLPAFAAELKKLGLSLADVRQIARDAGIELSETPTVRQLQQLAEYLAELDFSAFANSFAGAMQKLDAEFELFPQRFKSNVDRFRAVVAALNDPDTGAPGLFKGLAGIDTSTDAGRSAALAEIQRLFQLLADNKLTAADLNGLSLQEFFETLTRLKRELGDLPAAKTAAEKFAAALEALGVAVELGTLDAKGKLAKLTAAFTELFPELAASLDVSSAAAFKASLQAIIDGFAADGELSDAERAQIEILRALGAAFDAAADKGAEFVDALAALEDRFAIFGTTLVDQVAAILAEVTTDASIGRNAGFAILKGLTDGLDLATREGNTELRKRAQAIYDALAAGGITTEEQAVIDVITRILGLSADAAAETAKTAEQLAESAKRALLEARATLFALADAFLAVNDITDPVEILRVRVATLAKAFPELVDALDDFDLSTQAGRDALEAWIQSLIASPAALAEMAESLGISLDELVRQLLGLESAADDATARVATLAEALGAAFDEVDYGIELEGITDPIERLRRTVAGIGGLIPAIDQALAGIDLGSASGRQQAEAALIALGKSTGDASVRDAVLKLIQQLRSVPSLAPTPGGGQSASGGTTVATGEARFSAFATATVGQVDTMLTLLTRIKENTQTMAEAFLRGPGAVRAPVLPQFPQLVASAALGGGGLTFNVNATINVYPGVSPETARVAIDEGGDRIRRQIESIVETGGAQRLVRSQRARGVPLQT